MDYSLKNDLSNDLLKILDNSNVDGDGYDDYNVKIIVGQEPNIKEFKLHSIILSARSSYFKRDLSNKWTKRENGIKILRKPNIKPQVFKVILKYVYCGVFSLEKTDGVNSIDTLIAADELELQKLIEPIQQHIIDHETSWLYKNLIQTFQIIERYDLIKLRDYVIGLICKNPFHLFASKDFIKLDEKSLLDLLKRDDLNIEEKDLWKYLIKWGIANIKEIEEDPGKWTTDDFMAFEKTLRNFIPLIRFFHMDPKDYLELVRTPFKDILPENLDEDILKHYGKRLSQRNILLPRTPVIPFDSKIINANSAALLASWIDKKEKGEPYLFKDIPYKFKLLLRGSRDGFDAEPFHRLCDDEGPTIILVKVNDSGEIIGGYNPLDWSSVSETCRKSFIFSLLLNILSRISSLYWNSVSKARHKRKNGFIFSLSFDILSRISSEAAESSFKLPDSSGPKFGISDLCMNLNQTWTSEKRSYEKRIIDQYSFEIDEYEVFQVDKISTDNFSNQRIVSSHPKKNFSFKWIFVMCLILTLIYVIMSIDWSGIFLRIAKKIVFACLCEKTKLFC